MVDEGRDRMLVISSGHWKPGTGAKGLIDEVTEARKVVQKVSAIWSAQKYGHKVIIDNVSKNVGQNLNYLIAEHRKYLQARHFSIHFNSVAGTYDRGIGCEVLYADNRMKKAAEQMCFAICNASGLTFRGAKKRTNLRFLNAFPYSGLLIEVCFVNSKTDVQLYKKNFNAICNAIAQAAVLQK